MALERRMQPAGHSLEHPECMPFRLHRLHYIIKTSIFHDGSFFMQSRI